MNNIHSLKKFKDIELKNGTRFIFKNDFDKNITCKYIVTDERSIVELCTGVITKIIDGSSFLDEDIYLLNDAGNIEISLDK